MHRSGVSRDRDRRPVELGERGEAAVLVLLSLALDKGGLNVRDRRGLANARTPYSKVTSPIARPEHYSFN